MDEERDLTLIKVITMFLARSPNQDVYFTNEDLGDAIQKYLNHRIVIKGDNKGISIRLLEILDDSTDNKPIHLH